MGDLAAARRIDSPGWTPQLAGARLIAAFRALPDMPIFSAGPGQIESERPEAQAACTIIAATARHLADEDARIKLLTWARSRARGDALAEVCREKGWPRSSFERTRAAALAVLARGLVDDGVPTVILGEPVPTSSRR